jgi:chemotaxis protein MotB
MAGKGGGSWKVAYADFVTAMMAFFMVMWITAQNKEAKEAVSSYFQDPFGKAGESTGPVSALSGGNPASNRRGAQGQRPGVKTAPSESSGLGTTILFAPNSADLSEAAKSHLVSLAPDLAGIPQRIEIRGHASRAPLPPESPFRDAWSLSYARCQSAMQFLAEQGIEPERMRLSQAGAYQPATNIENAERQKENERVEVFVLREFVSPTIGVSRDTASAGNASPDKAAEDGHDAHATSPHAANDAHGTSGRRVVADAHDAGH